MPLHDRMRTGWTHAQEISQWGCGCGQCELIPRGYLEEHMLSEDGDVPVLVCPEMFGMVWAADEIFSKKNKLKEDEKRRIAFEGSKNKVELSGGLEEFKMGERKEGEITLDYHWDKEENTKWMISKKIPMRGKRQMINKKKEEEREAKESMERKAMEDLD